MKKIIRMAWVVVLALIIGCASTGSVLADTTDNQNSNSSGTSYFNEKTVMAYGSKFIKDTVATDTRTSWTADTKMSDITKTYDADGNVNAYIINLTTDNQPTGYLLIEAFTAGAPNIMEYGYKDKYYITDDKLFGSLKNKKLIYTGDRGFLRNRAGSITTQRILRN